MVDKYGRESMTKTEFLIAPRGLVKRFETRYEPEADEPETLAGWITLFVTEWLP